LFPFVGLHITGQVQVGIVCTVVHVHSALTTYQYN